MNHTQGGRYVCPSACFISNYQQDIYEIWYISNYQQDIYEIWYSDLQQKLLGELTFGTHESNITPTLHDTRNRFRTLSTNGPIKKKKIIIIIK